VLSEIPQTRQIAGEPRRRWFQSIAFDLVVWYDDQDQPSGFQLCYGKPQHERALTWNAPASYDHTAVDDGEDRPFRYKSTPILVPDGTFDAASVSEAFLRESAALPPDIVALVVAKLREHPEHEQSRA
jgi:hypothetical protein